LLDGLLDAGELLDYHLSWSARADLCRRLGRIDEARAAYTNAIKLSQQRVDRQFLERCLSELDAGPL
jgi:RNA polymerase sigma-70 factor (ECF subfamily)